MEKEKTTKLKPPTDEEFNKALARRMFGKHADKMLKYAPWSFLLVKKCGRKVRNHGKAS